MNNGAVLQNRYRLLNRVGQGGFGTVWLAQEILRNQVVGHVAIKCFAGNPNLREILLLSQLSHQNLISYRTAFEQAGVVYLVMEYADGGDLETMLKQAPKGLPADQARHVLLAVAEGLGFLHQRNIIHRDIKPGNIFVSGGLIKLGDFGLAKAFQGQGASHTGMGTSEYAPPEFYHNQAFPQSDIYSLGVTAYQLLVGKLPFEGTPAAVMNAHLTKNPVFPETLPKFWTMLLAMMMAKDPNKRPMAPQLATILKRGRISDDPFGPDAENPLKEVISDEVWTGIKVGKVLLDAFLKQKKP